YGSWRFKSSPAHAPGAAWLSGFRRSSGVWRHHLQVLPMNPLVGREVADPAPLELGPNELLERERASSRVCRCLRQPGEIVAGGDDPPLVVSAAPDRV